MCRRYFQTPNYCGKNKALRNRAKGTCPQSAQQKHQSNYYNKCLDCTNLTYKESLRCRGCADKIRSNNETEERANLRMSIVEILKRDKISNKKNCQNSQHKFHAGRKAPTSSCRIEYNYSKRNRYR